MLSGLKFVLVQQVHEMGEWFGFETRNKFRVLDESGQTLAYAAEQQKGLLGFLFRQYLGHWRRFEVHFFNPNRQLVMVAVHPFRWFFRRIEMQNHQGQPLGAIQARFSLFHKRFDVENERGLTLLTVSSPLWRPWTFSFRSYQREVARVSKKWSGLLTEAFTDKDTFKVEFVDPALNEDQRHVILGSAIFIDLLYFETKR